MKYRCRFKFSLLFIIVLMISGVSTLATAHGLIAEMPKTCQNINSAKLTFELPLEIEKLTLDQRKKIKIIIEGAHTQACILQMQYDVILQQVIVLLLNENDVTNEQLKPFFDEFTSLFQNKIENNLKTVISIHKILSDKEWQDLVVAYRHSATIQGEFINQKIKLQQAYIFLGNGNSSNDSSTWSLTPQNFCIKMNTKIEMLKRIIRTLPLTNTQNDHVSHIVQLNEEQTCSVKSNISKLVAQFLQLLSQQSDQMQIKQQQAIAEQLVSKEYLQEVYQIQTLLSLFEVLNSEQKTQLKEKYMTMKGIL